MKTLKKHWLPVVIILIINLISTTKSFSQNVTISDSVGYEPKNSAVLDVMSHSKGMLVPRLTTAQRNAIASPNRGLLVFDIDQNSFYFYNGTRWLNLSHGNASGIWSQNGNDVYLTDTSYNLGIGTTNPTAKFTVVGNTSKADDTLFVVRNKNGEPVFAVFPEGVRVWVDENSKGNIGGFAVSGRTTGKGINDFFSVSPDSVRIYIKETNNKGNIGGFAVSGRTTGKGNYDDYLKITADSFRIYFNENNPKGNIGGFAVSGRTTGKSTIGEYFRVTGDSVRVFIKSDATKGNIGGFAVSGRTTGKGQESELLRVTADSTRVYVEENTKGNIGGFAVSGRTTGKGTTTAFTYLVPENYFIGHRAGLKTLSSTGKFNSFFGYQSGMNNTTGSYNVFMGYESGTKNTTGSYNVFIGHQAGKENTLGRFNTFLGYATGQNNQTGMFNVLIGDFVAYLANKGNNNVLIGSQIATTSNFKGNSNVMIGSTCGSKADSCVQNVFLGDNVGFYNTTGSRNIFIGANAGNLNTTANDNIFIGTQAGESNTTGNNNFFAGNQSGYSNSTANFNVFIGNKTGYHNATGTANVFLGYYSGYNNINGGRNVFIGDSAGFSNTTGYKNVFMGFETGRKNIWGKLNVFIGNQSGLNNTLGDSNVFVGNESGYSNTSGRNNVFIGSQCGYLNDNGNYNVSIGYKSGYSNLGGTFNTMMGYEAGYSNTSNDNTFIGFQAGKSHGTGGGNVFIGSRAGLTDINGVQNIFIGEQSGYNNDNGSHNVYIGHQTGQSNTSGSKNVFLGYLAGLKNTTGHRNVFIGDSAGVSNTTGERNVMVGYYSGRLSDKTIYNTFIGSEAGENTVTGALSIMGSFNSFFGTKAGQMNTTGYYNSFFGNTAGWNNTTGARNTFMGNNAGFQNQAGNENTFYGAGAGYNHNGGDRNTYIGARAGQYSRTSATSNIALGAYAGTGNTTSGLTGNDNITIGYFSGDSLSTADSNIFMGSNTGKYITTQNSNIFIGHRAGETAKAPYNIIIGNECDLAATNYRNVFLAGHKVNATASNQVRLGNAYITSFYCQGAYAATTANAPNMFVQNDGQIMRSTATVAIGSGAANKLAFWSDANTLSSNNYLHWDNTNRRLGIGTTNPFYTLHVSANDALTAGYINTYIYNAVTSSTNNITKTGLYIGSTGTWNGTGAVNRALYATATGGTYNYAAIFDAGSVGIGTNSPTARLQINATETGENALRVQIAGNTKLYTDNNGGTAIGAFAVPPANGLYVSGNVGIGTSVPSSKLHIKASEDSWNMHLRLENYSTTGYGSIIYDGYGIKFRNMENDDAFFFRNSDNITTLLINHLGAVGIGTTNPNSRLHINATETSENGLRVQIAGSTKLIVDNNGGTAIGANATPPSNGLYVSGNVGIGISPSYQLELSTNSAAKPSSATWTISSDIRLKDVKGKYEKGLVDILKLEPIVYRYKKNNEMGIKETETDAFGFSAQEVQKIFPEAVGTNDKGFLDFNIHPILVAEINAFKELNQKIETQQQQINDLKKLVEELIQKNKELEEKIK